MDAFANGRGDPLALFPLRHTLSLLPRLGQRDRNRLLAAFDLAGLAAFAAPRRAAIEAAHFAFDLPARRAGIFSLPSLRHEILLTNGSL
jgi:hypothetical protein